MSFNFPALGTVVHWHIYLLFFFSTDGWLIGFVRGGRRFRNAVQHCKQRRLLCFPWSEHPSIHLPSMLALWLSVRLKPASFQLPLNTLNFERESYFNLIEKCIIHNPCHKFPSDLKENLLV